MVFRGGEGGGGGGSDRRISGWMEVYSENKPLLMLAASNYKPMLSDFCAVTHTEIHTHTHRAGGKPSHSRRKPSTRTDDDTKEVNLAT